MPKINCGVENCAYNHGRYCCASIINVDGKSADITESTCCNTFLDGMGYSNVQDCNMQNSTELDAILCKVETCVYHKDEHCTLQEIEIGSLTRAEDKTQTDCLSFERRTY